MDNNRRKERCKARDKESHNSVAMVRELHTKTIATFGPGMVRASLRSGHKEYVSKV
jgi:hypothetical protein